MSPLSSQQAVRLLLLTVAAAAAAATPAQESGLVAAATPAQESGLIAAATAANAGGGRIAPGLVTTGAPSEGTGSTVTEVASAFSETENPSSRPQQTAAAASASSTTESPSSRPQQTPAAASASSTTESPPNRQQQTEAAASASSTTENPSSRPQQTPIPGQSQAGRCNLLIRSNLYQCSDQVHWWQSKADLHELRLQLSAGQSETICCRDSQNQAIYSTLARHSVGQIGSRMRINCSLALAAGRASSGSNALATVVTGSDLHCYNLCNTTLSLGDRGRTHYNLFLPVHSAPVKCRWRLRGVSKVIISKSQLQVWNNSKPFLCLSDASHPRACNTEFGFAQRYPLSIGASEESVLTCLSGNCNLWYNSRLASVSLSQFNFRSFKVELESGLSLQKAHVGRVQNKDPSALTPAPTRREPVSWTMATLDTPESQLTPPESHLIPQPPPPRSTETFPLEFRVTRGVMAGVTAAAVALICVAACVWGYRSWHYRMYSSPLRRLLGRTPLHRLPTYSSRLFDLDRLQLDRPCSAKEVGDELDAPSLSSSSDDPDEEDVDEEEIKMMMELETDRGGFAGTATWRHP